MGSTDGIPLRRSRFARAKVCHHALRRSTRKWKDPGPIPGERLEDSVNNLRAYPRSIVVNDDFQVGASLGMPRRNGHASFLPTHAGNGLDRVTNKVENNLLQLAPI